MRLIRLTQNGKKKTAGNKKKIAVAAYTYMYRRFAAVAAIKSTKYWKGIPARWQQDPKYLSNIPNNRM